MPVNCLRKLPQVIKCRTFWTWLDSNYNKYECERLKKLGPDRACAEWLLRNGASVKWVGSNDIIADVGNLPPEGSAHFIKEIDATESSIAHHGFPVFKFCTHVDRMVLHGCKFLENEALLYLATNYPPSLQHLQISSCRKITDDGILPLRNIHRLQRLVLYDLPFVRDKENVLIALKDTLKNCEVTYVYKDYAQQKR